MLQFLSLVTCFVFTDIKVYQEKAIKDKERYQAEMEGYRERLKMGNVISDAVPLQQRLPESDASLVDVDIKLIGSPQTPVESTSSGSDYEDDDINMGATSPEVEVGVEATYVGSDKPSQDYELLPQCQREGDAAVQDVQKMNESKTMLALI